jgi:hypothetical protein
MVKITDKPNLEGRAFKSRGAGREASELTRMIQDKVGSLKAGRNNGFMLELEAGEDVKNIRPKVAAAAKRYKYVIRTETLEDDSGLLVWRDHGEWVGRGPRSAQAPSASDGEGEAIDPELLEEEEQAGSGSKGGRRSQARS